MAGTPGKSKHRVRFDDGENRKDLKDNGRYRIDSGDEDHYDYDAIVEIYGKHDISPQEMRLKAGRPLFVRRPDITTRICKLLRKGLPFTTVCRLVGVSRKTFLTWMELGYENHSPEYLNFYVRVTHAEARAEEKLLKKLDAHSKNDWRVSAWRLERRWPEHWGKRDAVKAQHQVEMNVSVTHKKEDVAREILTDNDYRDAARRQLEGEEFGYQRLADQREMADD